MPPSDKNVTVQVSFDPTTGFTFTPEDTPPFRERGRVTLERFPADAPWTFVSARVEQDSSGQFEVDPGPDRARIVIKNGLKKKGKFPYHVTIHVPVDSGTFDPSRKDGGDGRALGAAPPPDAFEPADSAFLARPPQIVNEL